MVRGRPRQFDEDVVLDRIADAFRVNGYERTAIADLVRITGVQKPSLYRAFGAKEDLFARVLHRYFDKRMRAFTHMVETVGPGVTGIQEFFSALRESILSNPKPEGCLLVTSSVELRGCTPGFDEFGSDYRDRLRALMSQLLGRATMTVLLREARSQLLVTWLIGLDVLIRSGASKKELATQFDGLHTIVSTWCEESQH